MAARLFAVVMLACVTTLPTAVGADILVKVDLSRQRMTVSVDGAPRYDWAVSTARTRFVTPTGIYKPYRMHRMWHSRKYNMTPMPHTIFYSGGYAIHGTSSIGMLGRPASHGCVRLAPAHAAMLYNLVKTHGMAATRIVIRGQPPRSRAPAVAERPAPRLKGTVGVVARNSTGSAAMLDGSTPYYYARPAPKTWTLPPNRAR